MTSEFIRGLAEAQLHAAIDKCERRIKRLETDYGTGVRPEWVGEDIGFEQIWIDRYRAELARRTGDSK